MTITKQEKLVKYVGSALSLEGKKTRTFGCTTKGKYKLNLC